MTEKYKDHTDRQLMELQTELAQKTLKETSFISNVVAFMVTLWVAGAIAYVYLLLN